MLVGTWGGIIEVFDGVFGAGRSVLRTKHQLRIRALSILRLCLAYLLQKYLQISRDNLRIWMLTSPRILENLQSAAHERLSLVESVGVLEK